MRNFFSLRLIEKRMKVTEILAGSEKTLFSLEVLPPLKGRNIQALFDVLDPLMEFNPPFVDVTYHREQVLYKKRTDGLLEEIPVRKRPGTVGICAAIQAKYDVETVPHLICGGFTREETEDALFSLHYLGNTNVLLIRGDAVKADGRFVPTEGGNIYASDLVDQVARMNKGEFLHEETMGDMKTDFCIGVAGYPEKHFEAPNMQADMKYLKKKIELGADYIVTQMFFDNQRYFDFVELCRAEGINVPIIPGIKPITSKKQIQTLPSLFHTIIPDDLCMEIEKCKDNDGVKQAGTEWTIQQCKELIDFGVPCIHFYTMSRSEPTATIARAVF